MLLMERVQFKTVSHFSQKKKTKTYMWGDIVPKVRQLRKMAANEKGKMEETCQSTLGNLKMYGLQFPEFPSRNGGKSTYLKAVMMRNTVLE